MKLLVLVFKRYKLNAVLASSHLVRPIANLLKRISMFFFCIQTLYIGCFTLFWLLLFKWLHPEKPSSFRSVTKDWNKSAVFIPFAVLECFITVFNYLFIAELT